MAITQFLYLNKRLSWSKIVMKPSYVVSRHFMQIIMLSRYAITHNFILYYNLVREHGSNKKLVSNYRYSWSEVLMKPMSCVNEVPITQNHILYYSTWRE